MPVPNTPTSFNVAFNSMNNLFTASWAAPSTPPAFDNYNIYVNDVSQSTFLNTTYSLPLTIANSGSFSFKATAVNISGESIPTNTITQTQFLSMAVSNLGYSQLGSILRISWTNPSDTGGRVLYYRIKIYNVSGPGPWPTREIKDISSSNLTSYDYTLTERGGYAIGVLMSYDGISYPYNETTIPPFSINDSNQVPPTPTPITITSLTGTFTGGVAGVNVGLAWPSSFGTDSYEVYLDSTSLANRVATPSSNSATINITVEGSHTFYVRGVNSVGNGSFASLTQTIYLPYSPPTHFVATPSNGQVSFSWVAPSYQPQPITSYKLDLTVVGGATTTYTISSSATTYTITGLTNDIYYTAGIYAYNASVPGTTTTVPQFKPSASIVLPSQVGTITTYGPPTGLEGAFDGTNVSTRLLIEWPGAANATSYNIYVDGIYRENFGGTQYYGFTTTTEGTYTISVRSYNSFGEGPRRDYTAIIYLPSSIPRNISLTAGNTSLVLTWQEPQIITREFSTYQMYLFNDSTGGPPIITPTANRYITTYLFTGLTIGNNYHVEIFVYDPLVESPHENSNQTSPSGTGTTTPPNPPDYMFPAEQGAIIFNSTLSTYYKFLWPATANATFYHIFKKDTPYLTTTDTSGTIIYSGDYSDPYAKIQAANSAGYSDFNGAGITVFEPFSAPTAVSATPGTASALISWTAPATQPRAIAAYEILLYTQGTNTISKSVITPTAATSFNVTDISSSIIYEAVVRVYEADYVNLLSSRSSPFSPQEAVQPPVISSYSTATVAGTPPVTRVSISYSGVNAVNYKRYVNNILISTSSSTTFTYDVSGDGTYAFKFISVSAGAVESAPTIRTETVYAPFSDVSFNAVTAGFESIDVEWALPTTRPRTITGYTVTATGGSATYTFTTTDPALRKAKVSGLTNGTSYSVSVVTNPGPAVVATAAGSYTPSSGAISNGESAALADLSGAPTPAAGQVAPLAGGITSPLTATDAIPSYVAAPRTDGGAVAIDIAGFPDVTVIPQPGIAKFLFAYENQSADNLAFLNNLLTWPADVNTTNGNISNYDIFTIKSCDAAGNAVVGGQTTLDLTAYLNSEFHQYVNPVLCHVTSAGIIDVVYRPTSGGIFTVTENPTFILTEGTEQGGAPIVNDEAQCPCAVRGYTLNLSTDRTQTTEITNRSNSILASSYVSNPQLYKRMDYSTLLRIKMGFAGRGK